MKPKSAQLDIYNFFLNSFYKKQIHKLTVGSKIHVNTFQVITLKYCTRNCYFLGVSCFINFVFQRTELHKSGLE